jgi:hypothetical protein
MFFLIIPVYLATAVIVARYSGNRKLGILVPVFGGSLMALLLSGVASQYVPSRLTFVSTVLLLSGSSAVLGSLIVRNDRLRLPRVLSGYRRHAFMVALLVVIVVTYTYAKSTSGLVVQGSDQSWVRDVPAYVGGFMVGQYFGTKGVSVAMDFSGSDPSAIQADNFLAVGIGVQSPNCCVDGLDYGYRIDAYLFHDGREMVVASAWQTCDVNIACGGRPWRNQMLHVTHEITRPATKLWLAMKWNDRIVSWYYGRSQIDLESFAAFHAPDLENPYFNVGELKGIVGNRPTGSAYFFQFGIISKYSIGHGGWRVTLDSPSYLSNNTWTAVLHAESIQGWVSYWKVLWRWGTSYDQVGFLSNPEAPSVTFYYSASTLESLQQLW